MWKIVTALLALLLAGLAYFIFNLTQQRKAIRGLPQPPMINNLIGHLHIAGECRDVFPDRTHPNWYMHYIREKYNLPEVFYVDWRPFGGLFLVVSDPALASQYMSNMPKSPLFTGYVDSMVGENNIVSAEGSHWKQLRSAFNPGFSAANLMTMVDYIVDAGLVFKDILIQRAHSGEMFEMEEYATRLTMDVIGKASLDMDMNSQLKTHAITKFFRERVALMPSASSAFWWQNLSFSRPLKLWINGRRLDQAINKELDAHVVRRARDIDGGNAKSTKRSVVALALAAYEKEMSMGHISGEKPGLDAVRIVHPTRIPADVRRDMVNSIKAFLFAGHDTSSSVIAWVFYLLHRYPHVQAKLAAELDRHFPPGSDAATRIRADPYVINKLEYLTAIIKETTRIFPPATTLRYVNAAQTTLPQVLIDPRTGVKYPMDLPDCHVWPNIICLHRNTRFFPDPTHFVPERFIASETPYPDCELFTPAGRDAWRTFEKGPRNCIGQELAMIEIKITMALTARELDFVVQYPGEPADLRRDQPDSIATEFASHAHVHNKVQMFVEGHRCFQILKGSAKPSGGMSGKIYLRPQRSTPVGL